MFSKRTDKQIKDELRREFENRCAYCGMSLGPGESGLLDRFYPRGEYPEFDAEPSNFVLACQQCNVSKGSTFPKDANGQPLLLHPRADSYEDHIRFDADGRAIALTDRGAATISVFHLNRPQLVERRKAELRVAEYFREYDQDRPDAVRVFNMSIGIVRSLAGRASELSRMQAGVESFEARYLRNMLYANVIGALEAYLSDTLISAVSRNEEALRAFVESFHDFKREKFELSDVFRRRDTIRERAVEAMRGIMYHDLAKVNGIYRDALNVELPDIGELTKCVLIRHDIVHRSGKTKDGSVRIISSDELEKLCVAVESFVNDVQQKVAVIGKG